MRINFSPQRAAIFTSFLGLLDIKLGAEIILLFGLINKVAGLYGLITIFVGGSFAQLLYYAYSVGTLFAFLWGLRVVKSESSAPTLLLSHLYSLDHIIVSLFHYIFYLHYWYTVPHDGRRTINSQAQQDLINLALSRGEITEPTGESGQSADELRTALAGEIWERERGFAVWTLLAGWILKIYFILVLYSYAAHLASSTYHTLPLTFRGKATKLAHPDPGQEGSSPRIPGESEDDIELRRAEQAARDGPSKKGKGKRTEEDDEDLSWE
ncbi:hypothetical protein I315_01752 [Cryptococcus gattii Ru294]|uniref:Uncharacterized protein n=3 Tax=Cryptococcus gattii species complex TaxID=1884637 RepID=E6QZY4_CRYGW|nr:Hypothetical protein CGB_B1140C [Cryptococcus gattii WM276]KIR55870.1 hypothetical protein I315_01752 [Cryptococcus gattii Ru294]KIR67145.1 hypothetical protein I314_02358 [Cryptococcus bacillisporus CA1873]KIR77446.1 hypothetical protein I306_05640 [Cryptococcus gattii EJB2]KIY36388.1 hypothetical protein I305_01249 [Cryptococcus gattii E566]KJE05961.1 hypothetical protein I311_00097 [Cryptococcus gattii NT-10]|eukprot:KIR67145.1 hypothetical protein I314_02358 [Cryptococcus gattii CA1873]